jgi:crotonobetainyl-CoA:carnitine CoA-transferase CaiB-like acyl-CoA transferase
MCGGQLRETLLAGVEVLDFTHILVSPTHARILADLGAKLIKVGASSQGDGARGMSMSKSI